MSEFGYLAGRSVLKQSEKIEEMTKEIIRLQSSLDLAMAALRRIDTMVNSSTISNPMDTVRFLTATIGQVCVKAFKEIDDKNKER